MARTNSLIGLATLTTALLLAACGKNESAARLMADAKQFQQQGDHKSALIQLKNAVASHPDDGAARLALGQAYNMASDPVSGEKELRKAMTMGLTEKALPDLLVSMLFQQQYQKVLDDTETVAYTAPAQVLALRGSAYLGLRKLELAKETYERALKADPANKIALLGLARLAVMAKDAPAAMARVDEAVARNPKDLEVWLFKGDMARSQGKPAEALAAYDQALAIDGKSGNALLQKAYLHIASGKYEEAGAALKAAKKATPNNLLIIYATAMLEFTQGHFKEALEPLQTMLRAAPEHMPSILMIGAVQFNLKSYPQADAHLKKYVEANPADEYGRKLLASVRIAAGDPKGALAALGPAIEATGDASLLAIAGKAYMDSHDYARATAVLEKASTLDAKAATLRTSLGLAQLEMGENERALAELEMATRLDTGSTEAATMLAMSALRVGQFDKALAALAPLEAQQDKDPLAYNLKGTAWLGKGDQAKARASFEKAAALRSDFFAPVDNLGRMDIGAGRRQAARQRYEAYLAANKNSVEALSALGAIAVAEQRRADATALFERAARVDDKAVGPAIFLASHYVSIGEQAKALVLVRKLQVSNPDNPAVLEQLGQLQFAVGETGPAMETFTKLTVVAPKSALAHYELGAAHMRMNNLPAAQAAFKRSLSLQAGYLDPQIALASVLVRQGQHAEALAVARTMQKQHPKLPVGFVVEGDILMVQKKAPLAVPQYEQAYTLGKNAELMAKLVDALRVAQKGSEAAARVAQWKRENPKDIKLASHLAGSYLATGQVKAAADELQQMLVIMPGYAPALNNLALAYFQLGDKRAVETAELALKASPDNPEVMDTAGTILAMRGNPARGVPLLQQALAKLPDSAEIRYHLVNGLLQAGDKAGAKREFDTLAARHKEFAQSERVKALQKLL
jgi:putative PEP-CTERM system TPR-repeat lipoprotein